MNSLNDARVAGTLARLHDEAETADRAVMEAMMAELSAGGGTVEDAIRRLIAEEKADYRATYRGYAGNFLAVSPAYGRFLYAMARAVRATRIVEFGTSMGVSALYLAAALRDNGGGRLVSAELEPGKVTRARAHLEAAGLADLVEVREGDALQTLGSLEGDVDLLHLDGAFSLYLPVLRLVEPRLRAGAMVLGENAFDAAYLAHVRAPAGRYLSQALPIDEGRGNEFSVRLG